MQFLPPDIEAYAERFTSPENDTLRALNRETWSRVLQPRMLSGHLQGRLLAFFSRMIRPKAILEVGTFTGYSALCMAEGLAPGGLLHTIEVNEELEDMIRSYVRKAGAEDKIRLHIGDARKVIPTLRETWDLVFIDADKEGYGDYYDLVFGRLRPGGFLVADNVLWSGNVLKPEADQDAETRALVRFSEKVEADERAEHLLLPVRDGLMLVRKKEERRG